MAKAVNPRKKALPAPLSIRLYAPGMTPLLRAGAGGLAASLRAILGSASPAAPWPSPVRLGPGTATVEREAIHLDWGGKAPEATLRALFGASFQVKQGFIDLPGTRSPGAPEPPPELAAALHDALKVTFLQHGKSTQGGARRRVTFEVDARPVIVESQGYDSFVHQTAWQSVLEALEAGATSLASWAYPGAAERHIGVRVTKVEYTAAEALCACFALVGCVSYKLPQLRGGAFVALAPTNLVRFAELRPGPTPKRLRDVAVAGASDAVLAAQLVMAQEAGKKRLGAVLGTTEAVALRQMPWNAQQKIRGAVVRQDAVREEVLDRYEAAAAALPHTLRVRKPEGKATGEASYFIATSALRAFITENLAASRPWYADFATATTAEGRFIHDYRDRDNLGALLWHERKGLIAMHPYLGEAEQWLVQSVHLALRSRFKSIYSDTKESAPATRSNRLKGERERLRLSFAGAKTPEQVRAALADLWSRAGTNRELQEHWRDILPLLGPERWRAARDLALVALASYQGKGGEAAELEDADEAAGASEPS
ncbi:CRISPR-associated protein Cas8a1/Csx13, MYXAN subtype/CRISPR-associated protein Cas8a1/Csx13, MYXAN subtype, C-terminal region [Myxococcus virescens]|uniref:CRISPR-associated protein Cas8a1/Csx13, MYXAN subtype/CRISPR-associated protein Cas8a1/Csx13, MYXAN subtype, C-terminal region n=1 Tax=Myxococcus virescens TaxID=83456 RepID=A0ABY0NEL0_9BACT|nr:CRISPR-associated protein Cas8a1/Csx13, MYXAN subtype/CRISPR-associated protein Cas8a1/Csx13, MYXAN subtype, C-terminal region [Myxococcus virescens]